MKKALFAVATIVLLASNEASAGLIFLNDWVNPMTVGDKTFTPLGHSFSTSVNAYVDIELSGNVHTGSYSLSVGGLGSVTGGLNGEVDYAVTINGPNWVFDTIALDVAHISDNSTVTKNVYSDPGFTNLVASLSATNGVAPAPFNIYPDALTTVYIRDTTVLNSSGSIAGWTNVFKQAPATNGPGVIPEPSSLTFAGLAAFSMLGITLWRRRTAR